MSEYTQQYDEAQDKAIALAKLAADKTETEPEFSRTVAAAAQAHAAIALAAATRAANER